MLRKRVDWREAWLRELFEHENCEECGKGASDHEAINVMGQPFARCLAPRNVSVANGRVIERDWSRGDQ